MCAMRRASKCATMKLQDLQSLQDIEYDIYVPKIHHITMIIVSVAFSLDQTVSTGCT